MAKENTEKMNRLLQYRLPKSVIAIFDQGLYSGTNFVLTLFLAKQLPLSDFGMYSGIVLGTYLVLSLMGAFFMQPFQVGASKIDEIHRYCSIITVGVVLFLVGFTLVFFPISIAIYGDKFPIGSAFFFVVAYLFQDFLRRLFLVLNKVWIVLGIDLLFATFLLFFVQLSSQGLSLKLVLEGIAWANILSCSYGMIYVIRHFTKPTGWRELFYKHCKEGQWLLSVALLQWVASNFFVMVSGLYLGAAALGALRLIQSLFGVLNVFMQAIENYFLPRIAALHHTQPEKGLQLLHQMIGYGGVIFGTILIVFCLFSDDIIGLTAGSQYLPYTFLMPLMAVLYVIIFVSYPVRILLRVHILNRTFFIGYALSFIASLFSFHFLLEQFGLWGACIGLMMNQLIMFVYWNVELKKHQIVVWKLFM